MAGRGWAAVCPAALRPGEEERKAPALRSSAAPPREDAKAEGTRAGLCADCLPGSRESGVLKVQLKPPAAGAKEGEVVSGGGREAGLLRTEHEPC